MNPVSLLRSPWAATLALALCMWAQIPHSQHVFERLANDESSGTAFAWGFEAAVLMFVVRNMHIASWFFAGLSALINVKYYEMGGTPMWGGALGATWGEWLVALANPFVIAMYSHVLAHVSGEAHTPLWWYQARGWVQGYIDTVQLWMQPAPVAPVKVAKPVQVAPVEDAPAPVAPIAVPSPDTNLTYGAVHIDKRTRGLQLLSEGFTVQQVAEELQANPNTVKAWKSRYSNGKEKVQ